MDVPAGVPSRRAVLASALPPVVRARDPRRRWDDWRARARVRRTIDRLVAPPPHRFRRFGRSIIVPPARVETPGCIAIGDGVVVHEHVWFSVVRHLPDVTPELLIEDQVRIGRCCQLSVIGSLVIERGAVIGDFVQIGDTFHPYEAEDRMAALTPPQPVRIGRGAVIGSHAVVLPGVTIGPGAHVEHHAVVGADVEPGTMVAGYPARPVITEAS
jgi:acetyltransferase-like isoleucine patch superfamily enzyme